MSELKLKFLKPEPYRKNSLRLGKNGTLSLVKHFCDAFDIKKDTKFIIGKSEDYPNSVFLVNPDYDPSANPVKVRKVGGGFNIRFVEVAKECGIKPFSEFSYERFDDKIIKLTLKR